MEQPSLTGQITPSSVLDPDPLKSSSSTPDCQNASESVKQPIPLQPAPTLQLPSSKATMPEFFTLKVSDTNSPIPVAIKQPNTSSAAQQQTAYHTVQHDTPKQSSHSQLINQPNERPASAHPTEVLAECDWSQLTQLLAEATDSTVEAAVPAAGLHVKATAQSVLHSTLPPAAPNMTDPKGQPSTDAGPFGDRWPLAVRVLQQWTWCPLAQISISCMSSRGMVPTASHDIEMNCLIVGLLPLTMCRAHVPWQQCHVFKHVLSISSDCQHTIVCSGVSCAHMIFWLVRYVSWDAGDNGGSRNCC